MDENLNLQPHDAAPGADVVLFAPEMLRLMDSRQRRLRQQLAECREAARQGDAQAQVQMGLRYLYGIQGAEKDAHKAFAWFSRTAPDDPVGLYWLSVCHNAGVGTPRDPAQAFALLGESAAMGYAPALCDLGIFYENGI